MELNTDDDAEDSVPLVSARAKKGKSKRKKGKRKGKPKYRDMVIRAVKSLKEPKGCTYNAIARYIEERYHVRNDFVLKHVINWLSQKKVLQKKGARVKLTGKSLKLQGRGKRLKSKKSKKKKKRKKAKKSKKRKAKKPKKKRKKKKKKSKKRRGKKRKGKRRR